MDAPCHGQFLLKAHLCSHQTSAGCHGWAAWVSGELSSGHLHPQFNCRLNLLIVQGATSERPARAAGKLARGAGESPAGMSRRWRAALASLMTLLSWTPDEARCMFRVKSPGVFSSGGSPSACVTALTSQGGKQVFPALA